MSTIGQRIEQALELSGMSVKDLERSLEGVRGASYANLHRYKSDEKKRPSAGLLDAIADATGVNPVWLAFGREDPLMENRVETEAARELLPGISVDDFTRARAETTEAAVEAGLAVRLPPVAGPIVHKAHRRLSRLERFDMEAAHEGGTEFADRLARRFGKALRAPLDAFEIDPDTCDRDELADYVVAVTTATARLVEHTVKNAPRLREAREMVDALKKKEHTDDA